MAYIDTAHRLVRPVAKDDTKLWIDGDCGRFPPTTILRILEREAIGADGELRKNVPFELVFVTHVESQFSVLVERGQYGTKAKAYPPGVFIDAVARMPRDSERPVYRGFEDVT